MKINLIIAVILCVFAVSLLAFFDSINKTEKFSGYIPVEVLPKTEWVEISRPLLYDSNTTIAVVVGNDTINAKFNEKGFFAGSNVLIHKDSYPPAIGKVVYVRGYKDNGQYYVEEAALIPLN